MKNTPADQPPQPLRGSRLVTILASVPRPLVSIVVNNYNYGRYLGRSIESALAQTYPRTEVVAVDDASTDGSREVIRRYPRVVPVFKATVNI